jgi:hypothetical protein
MATASKESKEPTPPAKKAKKDQSTSTEVTVFVPCGRVREGDILRAAVMGARDQIPMAAINVVPKVVSASDVRTDDSGTDGRDYLVSVTWTPRPTRRSTADEEDQVPATMDKVLESLEPLTAAKITAVTDVGPEA